MGEIKRERKRGKTESRQKTASTTVVWRWSNEVREKNIKRVEGLDHNIERKEKRKRVVEKGFPTVVCGVS